MLISDRDLINRYVPFVATSISTSGEKGIWVPASGFHNARIIVQTENASTLSAVIGLKSFVADSDDSFIVSAATMAAITTDTITDSGVIDIRCLHALRLNFESISGSADFTIVLALE